MFIAILEDNAERTVAMRACLADRFYMYDVEFFVTAEAMIAWLTQNIEQVIVISLDHDLEPQLGGHPTPSDPGTGRQVANFIAQRAPRCPVVIHSSNAPAALGMIGELTDGNWITDRVVPYDDVAWIAEA